MPTPTDPQGAPESAESHVAAARALAGTEVRPELLTVLCGERTDMLRLVQPLMMQPTDVPPGRAFDNLYYLGTSFVGAWAITTSDGIILIDALNSWREARDLIEGGLRAVGLDAAQVRALVVMHGHGDHYGGARYLQERYGTPIYMSAADWEFAPRWLAAWTAAGGPAAAAMFGPIPERDRVVADGERLTVGDTTVTFYLTPGHTPGCLSAVIPVRDGDATYKLALWGGTALPDDLPSKHEYRRSVERFIDVLEATRVDGIVTAHPFVDGTLDKLAQLQQRRPGGPHPFVTGADAVRRYMDVHLRCVRAAELR